MNALSWLIYLAGVCEKLAPTISSMSSWFATLAVISALGSLVLWAVTIFNSPNSIYPQALAKWYKDHAMYPSLYPEKSKPLKEHFDTPNGHWTESITSQKKWLIRLPVLFTILAGVFSLVYPLIPAKETVYAIAASEIAEEVVTDPRILQTTNKAFAAVDAWLDKQLEPTSSSTAPSSSPSTAPEK